MKSSTGRWVGGQDFFNRDAELKNLGRLIQDRNHVLLSGQRRMGKTSVVRELGHRFESMGWLFFFSDVEGATCPEDAIASIAQAVHSYRPIATRYASSMGNWIKANIEELGALDFKIKIRAGLDAQNWKRSGEQLFQEMAAQEKKVLLAIDELPIFLKRMLAEDGNSNRVEEFLSWFRGVVQNLGDDCPTLIVSGSVGLEPLVRRLRISDRINHLYPYRLKPWDRATSIACFERLAESNGLACESIVAEAVYDSLGIGIPHHVQSFFARLSDYCAINEREHLTRADVDEVYRTELLGSSGQSDLVHYETRLKDTFDDETYSVAMKILAEAAVQGAFTISARRNLENQYESIMSGPSERISEAVDVLKHDGYLIHANGAHRFPSRLLKDWFASRYRDHHTPLDPESREH